MLKRGETALVIDVGEDMIGEVDYTILTKEDMCNGRAKLKPMPQKLAENFGNNTPTNTYIMNGTERQYLDMFAVGYNKCIDKILGEQE